MKQVTSSKRRAIVSLDNTLGEEIESKSAVDGNREDRN